MPLILLPIAGAAIVALWWIERHKPQGGATALVPAPGSSTPGTFGFMQPRGLAFSPGSFAPSSYRSGTSAQPSPSDMAALSVCQAQFLLARMQAGATGAFTMPSTLAQCQSMVAAYQSVAQARSLANAAAAAASSGGGAFGGSASASAQMTLGVGGGSYDLATAAVVAAMGRHVPDLVGGVDDGVRLCTWALKGANSKTIRGLMQMYATRPQLVACLSRRLAQIEPLGL